MNTWFNIIMPSLIALLVWGAVAMVRRLQQHRAAWESGLTATARVVRAWQTIRMVDGVVRRTQWHEYACTTADGGAVRCKEAGGPPTRAEGDETLVYYTAADPDKATAYEPRPGRNTAQAVYTVVFFGVAVACILYYWLTLPEV